MTPAGLSRAEQKERGAAMAAAVVSGEAPASVARRFGVTSGTVYAQCRARGLVLRSSKEVGHYAQMAARRRLVVLQAQRGATHREIAASLGFREDSIRHICAQAGVRLRPVRGSRWALVPVGDASGSHDELKSPSPTSERRARRYEEFASAVTGGLSVAQAAAKFAVCRGTVYGALRDSGATTLLATVSSQVRARRSVLQMARRGNDARAIAERTGRSEAYVRALCKKSGVRLQTRADRIEAARVLARHLALKDADLAALLDGRHVEVLRLLRDTALSIREIAERTGRAPRSVFDAWTLALHRLAVPNQRDRDQLVAARKRVLSSGISLRALGKGRHHKLLISMRDSGTPMLELARNAELSSSAVWHLWFLALDRAAIAAARLGPVAPAPSRRRRRTARPRRLLRDLVL